MSVLNSLSGGDWELDEIPAVRDDRRPLGMISGVGIVADQLADERRFRPLTVLDLFTRECLVIDVGQGLSGRDFVSALERLRFERGLPQRIYCDNGTEFVSAAMDLWAHTNGVMLDFSRRDNASCVAGMSNVLDDTKQHQILALGRLGWSRRRIEQTPAVHRETISAI